MGLCIGSTVNVKNVGRCKIVAMPILADQILPIVENEVCQFQVNMTMVEPIKLDYDIMIGLGFTYEKNGASGADTWQGYGFWWKTGKVFGQTISFRGDKLCKYGLKLNGFINSNIEYLHQIEVLYNDLMMESIYDEIGFTRPR